MRCAAGHEPPIWPDLCPACGDVEQDRLRARVGALEGALGEALELADEGWAYVDAYFREKWQCSERSTALRGVLQSGTP